LHEVNENMNRRKFIQSGSMMTAASFFYNKSLFAASTDFTSKRPPRAERKFTSEAVEELITQIKNTIPDKQVSWLFENCFPNTLDTTVDFETANGEPDTYVITGDIDAMWLRDSSAQVWPYLSLVREDKKLQQLIKGVIRRQTQCILLDPYANAFYKDPNKISEWKDDLTEMKPGIHERKWEIDSLCYPIRLAHKYWQLAGDHSPFNSDWQQAMLLVLKTLTEQQRKHGHGPYTFQRTTSWATDGVPLSGYGYPVKPVGLICSMFRPSDDATIFPFLIPSNFFGAHSIHQMFEMLDAMHLYSDAFKPYENLHKEITNALKKYAYVQHAQYGKVIAYEVNGFGSYNLMDDANVPSLLSLPYLTGNSVEKTQEYISTRKMLLSEDNPFFFKGNAGEGIGGPHTGMDYIWPMSITMRALTSNSDAEINHCLKMLVASHAGTGFMHESFHKDDASKFTRKWFAWANTLFGELIVKLYHEKPDLLKSFEGV
jgi:meiotically up-regulated gene 157 (Mug157) protein